MIVENASCMQHWKEAVSSTNSMSSMHHSPFDPLPSTLEVSGDTRSSFKAKVTELDPGCVAMEGQRHFSLSSRFKF